MTRKGGLGRGLESLIPTANELGVDNSGTSFVNLDKIVPNPRQPRMELDPADLQDLAESIRQHGVIQPLIVTYDPNSDEYTLIAGERRLRAARIAGLQMVPVLVRQATDQEMLELALIENVQRADLTPLETAEAYAHLSDEFNLSHEEIAVRVGKSREAVTNTMRLLKLPQSVRQALASGKISEGHARALQGLPNPQAQDAALATVLRFEMNVRQTEDLVRKLKGERRVNTVRPASQPEIQAIEERLRASLGTRVLLRHGKKGGSLVIHYYSNEELDALLKYLIKDE